MSSLEFNINARDQASQVVASVQKKVADFGKDVGKSIAAIVGPMAVLQYGIGKVTEYFDEMARKSKEALDWGAGLGDTAKQLGVTGEEFQRITEAATRTGDSVENVGKAFKLARDLIDQARVGSTDAAASITALGLNIEDLDKLNAQDVLKALAGAMAATADPAERARIAVAALGKEAAALQATLAKGFDIGGALEGTIGLTNEEIAFLRLMREKEAGKANQERLAEARRQVAAEFLSSDPEAQRIRTEAQQRAIKQGAQGAAIGIAGSVDVLSRDKAVQLEIIEILKQRKAKKDAEEAAARAALAATPAAQAASQALSEKAAQDAEREAKKKEAKDEQKPTPKVKLERTKEDKPVGVTVSSLREIGGGLAGEMSTFEDVAFQSLGEQKQMNETLRRIEAKLIPSPASTDFTKDPRVGGVENFTPGNFTPGPMTAASRIGVA